MDSEEKKLETEYYHENIRKTLDIGKMFCTWGLPVVAALAIGEAFVYGYSFLPVIRLAFIIPAGIFLFLSYRFFPKHEKYIIPFHLLTLSGSIFMMLSIAFYRFISPQFSTTFQLATITGGLVTMVIICFIFAAGARKYLIYLVFIPLIALFMLTYSKGNMTFRELSFLVNPLSAALAASLYTIYDENKNYTAYINKRKAELSKQRLQKELEDKKIQELILRKQLEKDSLTGVYNRELAFSIMEKMISLSQPYTLCFIDIDNFKLANDLYGHLYGDNLLIDFAQFLKDNLRKTDYLCRIGGDEFLAILPNCGILETQVIIERIRDDIKNRALNDFKLDFSYGISQFHSDEMARPKDLLEIADRKMYSYKLQKNLS